LPSVDSGEEFLQDKQIVDNLTRVEFQRMQEFRPAASDRSSIVADPLLVGEHHAEEVMAAADLEAGRLIALSSGLVALLGKTRS